MTEKTATFEQYVKKNVVLATTTPNHACKYCGEKHFLYRCDKFLDLTAEQRYKEVIKMDLCISGFKTGRVGRVVVHKHARDVQKSTIPYCVIKLQQP